MTSTEIYAELERERAKVAELEAKLAGAEKTIELHVETMCRALEAVGDYHDDSVAATHARRLLRNALHAVNAAREGEK